MVVTPLYAGLLALLYFVLSYRVIQRRRSAQTSLGDGGDPMLLNRIRAHGNFAEYVPIILLMIGLLELSHWPALMLHALGLTLLIARLLHACALSFAPSFMAGRTWGTGLSFLLLVVCAALCLCQAVGPYGY